MYVKLVSSDNHEFIIKREHAVMSGTIRAILSEPGRLEENEMNRIQCKNIPSHILYKVCLYLAHKACYQNSTSIIPEFTISSAISLDLLVAATFFDL